LIGGHKDLDRRHRESNSSGYRIATK